MRPRYRFMFTGFRQKDTDQRAHLVNKIQRLGGIYYEAEHFKLNCTHVICARLCRSEKFLCACAAGKWVVTPEFIEKSFDASEWLKEEDYEWKFSDLPINANDALVDLCRAPRRSRQFVAWQYGKGLFAGKTFVLFISELDNRDVYKRILIAGGAKVVTKTPPVFDFSLISPSNSDDNDIKFVLVTENHSFLTPIFRANVLCISTDYIRNFLLKKSPPDVSEFDITSYVPNSDAYCNVGMGNSPIKHVLTKPPLNSPFRTTYSTLGSTGDGTGKGKTLPKLVPFVICEKMDSVKTRSLRKCCKNVANKDDQVKRKLNEYRYVNCGKRRILGQIVNTTDSAGKVIGKSDPIIDEKLQTLQIMYADSAKERSKKYWAQKILSFEETHDVKDYSSSCIFESCFIDEDWRSSLCNFTKLISPRYLIPAEVIRKLIDTLLLNAPCEAAASQMYSFLTQMLRVLPPHNFILRKWYYSILEDNSSLGGWNFVSQVICVCLSKQPTCIKISEKTQFQHTLFLHFLQLLLEQDFAFFIRRYSELKLNSAAGRPMIVRLLWGTKSALSLNNSCSELLSYLVASIHKASSYTTILSLQKLNALMLESARLSEAQDGADNDIPYNAVTLIQALFHHVRSYKLSGQSSLLVLDSMELAWSKMLLAQILLDSTSQLINNAIERINCELTLRKIVNYYMKLIPLEKTEPQQSEKNILPTTGQIIVNPVGKNKKINVTRRNAKGETALHTACIHNRVETVRKLLSHPGIDVNAVDNAGWAPLHEACNRGNIDCVRQLLGSETTPRVDVMAKNVDGITPLHDAVMNDHFEIARLLLDHGGRVLLDQIDNADRSPIDLAVSSAMSSLLLNFEDDTQRLIPIPRRRFEDDQIRYVSVQFIVWIFRYVQFKGNE
uniref:BRCT domain-containing protein n=1 Tax=Strigamia maritima TaxID=126957 RepID=T1JIZ8_STRMM